MRELDLLNAHIDSEAFRKHAKGSIGHVVVAHMKNSKVTLRNKTLLERLNLSIRQLVAHEIELANGDNNEKG